MLSGADTLALLGSPVLSGRGGRRGLLLAKGAPPYAALCCLPASPEPGAWVLTPPAGSTDRAEELGFRAPRAALKLPYQSAGLFRGMF